MKLAVIPEIHTSHLGESCLRRVRLKAEGHEDRAATTALVRGMIAHEALRAVHEGAEWARAQTPTGVHAIVMVARLLVAAALGREGRAMTDAVQANLDGICDEVEAIVGQYARRFGERFMESKLVGCELPCRMEWEGEKFASHMDLVFEDTAGLFHGIPGALVCWDWKYRDEAPTHDFLARWPQGIVYWQMLRTGRVAGPVDPVTGGREWATLGAGDRTCLMAWIHLPHLKPFGRAVTSKDDRGVEQNWKKGDTRPERSVVRPCSFVDKPGPHAMEQVMATVALIRSGIDACAPDPVGCHLCVSKQWCRRNDEDFVPSNGGEVAQ